MSIFVAVGNATQGFPRLLNAIEKLASENFFQGEEVLIQSGNNPDFQPIYCQCQPFFVLEEFEAKIRQADLVICQAGTGTLLQVLEAGQFPIVMPRRKKDREIIDDHQLELVEELAVQQRIIPAYEIEDLPSAIAQAKNRNLQEMTVRSPKIINFLEEAVNELIFSKK
jgi:UDP-N-acetylglucosamine transferase subunit ALG13